MYSEKKDRRSDMPKAHSLMVLGLLHGYKTVMGHLHSAFDCAASAHRRAAAVS